MPLGLLIVIAVALTMMLWAVWPGGDEPVKIDVPPGHTLMIVPDAVAQHLATALEAAEQARNAKAAVTSAQAALTSSTERHAQAKAGIHAALDHQLG